MLRVLGPVEADQHAERAVVRLAIGAGGADPENLRLASVSGYRFSGGRGISRDIPALHSLGSNRGRHPISDEEFS
jgi:hypothetical protein